MSNLSVFDFEGYQVRFVGTAENPEWVAADVATVLGIQNIRQNLASMEAYQKGWAIVDTPGGRQKVATINLCGLKALICKSRSHNAKNLAKAFGIEVYVSPIESDCIGILDAAFADLDPIRQFPVGRFRIDLYLSKVKIAIECDENHHKRQTKADSDREREIDQLLCCKFLRFNPHSNGFSIGDVIYTIRQEIRECHK